MHGVCFFLFSKISQKYPKSLYQIKIELQKYYMASMIMVMLMVVYSVGFQNKTTFDWNPIITLRSIQLRLMFLIETRLFGQYILW